MVETHLAPTLDQSLTTLLEDLDQRGLLESTLVVIMGEFGRTPDKNPYNGRDHWPECWSMGMGGGGIKPGVIVGKTNDKGTFTQNALAAGSNCDFARMNSVETSGTSLLHIAEGQLPCLTASRELLRLV